MPKGAKKELTSTGEKRLKTLVGRLRTFRVENRYVQKNLENLSIR